MKKCTKCGQQKELPEFYRRVTSLDGRRADCADCRKKYDKHRLNLPSVKSRRKELSAIRHSDPVLGEILRKKYRERYHKLTEEQKLAKHQRQYKNNKKKYAQWNKEYRLKNKDKIASYMKEYIQKRRRDDVTFKLNDHISRLINHSLHSIGLSKRGNRWWELVGYKTDALKKHLESQFVNGMSWDNYGKWHIDHIIPQDFFVFNSVNDVEFKMCWRLENLQPLWASDNIRKSNKIKAVA